MRLAARNLSVLLLLAGNSYPALASSNSGKSKRRPSPGCSKSNQNSTSPSLTSLPEPLKPGTERNFTLPPPTSATPSGDSRAVAGVGRPYTLFVPDGYDAAEPAPLIVSLHGAGRTARWQAELDGLAPHEGGNDNDVSTYSLQVPGFNDGRHLVVYPQSTGTTSDDMFWEGYPGLAAGVDDVGYVLAVLDAVGRDACIDEARVYGVGKSQGGGLVNVLACDADGRVDGRFAALASVSGAYYVPGVTPEDCRPDAVEIPGCGGGGQNKNNAKGGITPFLAFHGGNDTTIAYAGGERRGYCLPSIQHWVDEWVRREGLREEPLEVRNLTGGATAYVYGDGKGSGSNGVFTFVYDGDRVGHDWPATFGNTDNEEHGTGPASFNASSLIMDFFRNYSLS